MIVNDAIAGRLHAGGIGKKFYCSVDDRSINKYTCDLIDPVDIILCAVGISDPLQNDLFVDLHGKGIVGMPEYEESSVILLDNIHARKLMRHEIIATVLLYSPVSVKRKSICFLDLFVC